MNPPRTLDCGEHGKMPWTGQVICIACDRVWHLNVHNPPTADGACTCGKRLSGPEGTGRAICARCYVQLATTSRATA